ncbi:MAG: DUF1848 domain-containing protein [Planctomycetes bacterium]|nr:DUF1848 domain-containing protein [Planctomycetota bacterium]
MSRRTDVPAFYSTWFMNRVREGRVRYANPFGGQQYEVSLLPEDVHAFVFWSKDYKPMIKHLTELESRGYDFYFHFTITGLSALGGLFEGHVPPAKEAIKTFKMLSERYGPKRVLWRFDPIIISNITGADYYKKSFAEIAAHLKGTTERCYFSFVCLYEKVRKNLLKLARPKNGGFTKSAQHVICTDPDRTFKISLANDLADIAGKYGITLYSCCGDYLVSDRIKKAQCIDGELLYTLFPHKPKQTKVNPTRKECGCVVSRDIGAYDTCPHGCIYCYANINKALAYKRYSAHNPGADMLYNTEGSLPVDGEG